MSQPIATAALALAIAAVLTAAIAIATSAAETPNRAVKVTALGAIVVFVVVALHRAELHINLSGSMPVGVYLLSPLSPGGVKRGTLVAACAPTGSAEIGARRAYLGAGPCERDTELLLKSIVAVEGDEVDVTSRGVTINGCLLPRSRPEARDQSGRPLLPWPLGHYRLASRELWLYAPNARSWDSRYWGPVSVANIEAAAILCICPWARFALRPPTLKTACPASATPVRSTQG